MLSPCTGVEEVVVYMHHVLRIILPQNNANYVLHLTREFKEDDSWLLLYAVDWVGSWLPGLSSVLHCLGDATFHRRFGSFGERRLWLLIALARGSLDFAQRLPYSSSGV